MTKTSISEAKNQLSALIKRVQKGEPILITDRGVPVAKLVPVQIGEGVPDRILALAQQGLVRLPERHPDAAWLDAPRPTAKPGPSAVDYLLEERREGR
jgi:prevent-host-death family protein